jgi:hypothetical protein
MLNLNPTTPLEEAVADWYTANAEEGYTSCLEQLAQHGCASGKVSGLIYYRDTTMFFLKHQKEIWALINQLLDDFTGRERTRWDLLRDYEMHEYGMIMSKLLNGWVQEDPYAMEIYNRNLLAWFGFEETAQRLAASAGGAA